MAPTRLSPPLLRRLAPFLVAIALVATISPGLALAANGPPKPEDDVITTAENLPATGNVLANDGNLGDGPLVVTGFGALAPSIGTLTVAADGDYSFTPALNWNGSTSTTYTVTNGGHTRTGNILITVTSVNEAPVADDDTVTVIEDTATDVTAELLANDSDNDGDTLVVASVSNASGGSVELAAGVATFTPAADLCGDGVGSFDYVVSDGNGGSASAGVTVDVTCENDAPVAVDDTVTVSEDTASDVTAEILANDSDIENDPLSITGVSNASGGEAVLDSGTVTFTPTADLCGDGAGSFDYDLSDGNGGSDSATVTVDISCDNDAPVANDDTVSGTEDTPLTIDPADLLANDTDADGDSLSLSGVSNASGGAVALDGGEITFTPAADLCGTGAGSFDYDVSDGNGGSGSATVSVDLSCVNDAPVATDDTGDVPYGAGPTDFDVLDNDSDPDGDSLTLVSASVSPTDGTADVVGGMVQFTPLGSFSGPAVITYVVSDGVLEATGTLTVTVGDDSVPPIASAPTVTFGIARVDETAPLNISWSATDAATGVASYEVQASVGGGAFTTIYTGTKTSILQKYPFSKSLVWRMRATDGAGNVSAWATSATRKLAAYQRSTTYIAYTGTWTRVPSAGSSGTSYEYTTSLGKRATFKFTGQEVMYVAPKDTKSGYAKVYVDGNLVGRFKLRATATQLGRVIVRAKWGSSGAHSIRVVNDQGGRRTNLDAFIVLK